MEKCLRFSTWKFFKSSASIFLRLMREISKMEIPTANPLLIIFEDNFKFHLQHILIKKELKI